MIEIKFPDGSMKNYEQGVSGFEIAESISKSLEKSAMAIEVDGKLYDLSTKLEVNSTIRIITIKDIEALEIIRHDAAHILAQAVKTLFPDVQVTIGPAIENGFYYDFAKDKPFELADLEKIEAKMYEIVKNDEKFVREVWHREDAVKFFRSIGEFYKAEIIDSIPNDEPLTLYRQGNFIDLCRGPHSPSTGKIKYFKLTKLAGAYWRGDSKNEMLQRIYGTAWARKEDLDNYLFMIEEAAKRDHRKIGKELDLFHFDDASVGMPFWHDHGWTIFKIIENYIRKKIRRDGYQEVRTPTLVDRTLWERSGHWEKYRENMYISEFDEKVNALKPMNCPCHVQIFKQGQKSYRDLPIRMAEFGTCHRHEATGALHGLMRVRSFVQDDAHIFCTEEQITSETVKFCKLLTEIYSDFGFQDFTIKFSTRPDVRAGSDEIWDKAENALKEAVLRAGYEYILNPGDGAFYGPKLDFILKDAIGRDWQCGTLQVDFVLPERLDANYIDKNGEKVRPVMLHRAVLGSFERFIGILIEEYSGKFPLWLAPVQVVIATITNDSDSYAYEVNQKLIESGIRSDLDISSEKINYKIRKNILKRIPLIIVVGKEEMNKSTVSVRKLGSKNSEELKIEELIDFVKIQVNSKKKFCDI
jgi:threonyl-tRNA synthetase